MVTSFVSIGKISQKEKKLKMKWFYRFPIAKNEQKKFEVLIFLDLQCVTKNRKRWLEFFSSYMIYI